MDLSGKAAVIGVGASSFAARPDASALQFAGEALAAALSDAGLEKEQIDGLIVQVGSPRGVDYDSIAQTFGLSAHFCSQTWAHGRFAEQVVTQGGKILGGDALQPTATATSIRGDVVTDGPFAETKEALGGFYLVEARDLDQALAFGKLCPAPYGGVEVRPVMDTSGGPPQG